jgi:hypothetical protein
VRASAEASGPSQRILPCLAELARDRGWVGQALSTLPGWLLRAADKWAEQQTDYEQKREVGNRLPFPDPWRYLLDAPAVPDQIKKVCRACQSQLWACRHIGRMRMGFATLSNDQHEKAMKAKARGDQKGYARAIAKFANQTVIYGPVQQDVKASANNPEVLRQMKVFLKNRQAQLVHRGQGKDADQPRPWPAWDEFASRNKLPVALVSCWVSFPEIPIPLRKPAGDKLGLILQPGMHGLMFFRNEALTEFLKFILGQANLTAHTVKKVRQRLRLIPVGDTEHLIWNVSIKQRSSGDWDLCRRTRSDT